MSFPRSCARYPTPWMSRRFSKPSVTPWTMLAIRLRVRPWRARCSPRSVGRLTTTTRSPSASDSSTVMSRDTRSSSSPRGPLTRTSSGSMKTSTPEGTGIGCFPIRLTVYLPDVRHDLAANAGAASVVARHDAARGRDDRGSHPAEDLRDLPGVDVRPPPRARHALEPGDHRLAVLGVLQPDADHVADARRADVVVVDVALLAQDPGELDLEPRRRDLDVVEVRGQPVADPRQEVGDWVRHRYRVPPTSSTWSDPARSPREPSRAGRSGTGRTCGSTRADGRSACSGCSCAS